MGNSVHLSQKRKLRGHSQKNKKENIAVIGAHYIIDFSIAVSFSTGKTQLVNFLPLFEKFAKGDNLKYFAPERFKKFIVKNGNIYWGRSEDIVFPVSLFFKTTSLQGETSDEILYII